MDTNHCSFCKISSTIVNNILFKRAVTFKELYNEPRENILIGYLNLYGHGMAICIQRRKKNEDNNNNTKNNKKC